LTDSHGFKEFFVQDFSRMYWYNFFHRIPSMIINYFNMVCVPVFPLKTNAPLLIDANAVLSFSVP
jgi:hypothetical protein